MNEIFHDPRFWISYLSDGAQPREMIWEGRQRSIWNDSREWWGERRAAWSEDPLEVILCERNDVVLELEIEDSIEFFIRDINERVLLASVGGAWRLPGLRVTEYLRLPFDDTSYARKVDLEKLLLPVVWLTTKDERENLTRKAIDIFLDMSGRVEESENHAKMWLDAVDWSSRYSWENQAGMWTVSSPMSCRSIGCRSRDKICRLLGLLLDGDSDRN